jgi:hypothetical protein
LVGGQNRQKKFGWKRIFGGLKAYLRATDHTSSNIISRDGYLLRFLWIYVLFSSLLFILSIFNLFHFSCKKIPFYIIYFISF